MTVKDVKILDFVPFKTATAKQFERMSQHTLFRVNVPKDLIWETYLASFPEGSNPIFKERTEHDCNCCKSFIRNIGNVVAIIDGKMESIWDAQIPGGLDGNLAPYQIVSNALSKLVKEGKIENIYLNTEKTVGTDKNVFLENGTSNVWNHFFVNLPTSVVVKTDEIGPKLGAAQGACGVFLRGLMTLNLSAVDTVLELISQNSLYKGEENRFVLTEFRKLKNEFDKLVMADETSDNDLSAFAWSKFGSVPGSVSGIRNTSIGALLINLSDGMDLEDAVKKYEAMVAPSNYKRPTALVTKAMVEQAQKKVQELNLMSALSRRYANLTDISVNDILFANRASSAKLTGNVFDELAASMPVKVTNFDKIEEVTIEKFIRDILPSAKKIEVLLENRLIPNFVTLIAPSDPTAGNLFKWPNNFSWAYNGEFADSVKERVKAAGGNVSGDLCCRLAWYNYDDLDLWMVEPGGRIFYGDKRPHWTTGQLDVDMNAGGGTTRTPVENIFYPERNRMVEGVYTLGVHQFSNRDSKDPGFEVEFDFLGDVHRYSMARGLRQGENVIVVKFKYTKKNGVEILESLPGGTSATKSTTEWNLETNNFHNVKVLMNSPNHWEDSSGVGNRHFFFMLEGCIKDGPARGFFNEYLKEELNPHRKAFEMVGAKMMTPESDEQLSGIGFSSTQRNHVVVRVTGAITRKLKIIF